MKKVIRLTESDLVRIVKRVINEQTNVDPNKDKYLQQTIKSIVDYANTMVGEVNKKFPTLKVQPFTIERVELGAYNPPSVAYKIKWGVDYLSWNGDAVALDIMAQPKSLISAISAFFSGAETSGGYAKHIKRYPPDAIQMLSAIQKTATEMMTKNFAGKPALPTPTKKP
jgi:hypothetical protein